MRSHLVAAAVLAIATASATARAEREKLTPVFSDDDDAQVAAARENPAAKQREDDRIGRPDKTMRFALGGEAGLLGGGAFLQATYPISSSWALGGRAAYGSSFGSWTGNECFTIKGGGWYSTMDVLVRGRTRLSDWVDLWGSVGAGLALRESSDQTNETCLPGGPLVDKTFAESGAVFSAAIGLEAFGTQNFSIEPGLRVQYSTIGNKMPDGADRSGLPVPIALATVSFAFHVAR
jgi:hypothetical protein